MVFSQQYHLFLVTIDLVVTAQMVILRPGGPELTHFSDEIAPVDLHSRNIITYILGSLQI